jgi:hypothetical protein
MPMYRAYVLNLAGRIVRGEWVEAENLEEARAKARNLCDTASPVVELWQGPRRLDELPCEPPENEHGPRDRP